MPVSDAVQERFIRLPEVMHLCGLSRSTIYDLISRGGFPETNLARRKKRGLGAVGNHRMDGGSHCRTRNRGYDA
ncbi:AlpA family phage regulatory protein [Klebsiella pneumoniae subsp. pneumoniae]|nr:AlpA family phage regulatory protein [Klebsiella pneumoniae subsp. pneumoniae]